MERSDNHWDQREIVLSNKISLLLIPLTITGLVQSIEGGSMVRILGLVAWLVFLVSVFPINKYFSTFVSKLGLALLPYLLIFGPFLLEGYQGNIDNISISFLFIGLSLIPLLLFNSGNSKYLLYLMLAINMVFLLFHEVLLSSVKSENSYNIGSEDFFYLKLGQLILWIFIVGSFQFLMRENNSAEAELKSSNDALTESNNAIQSQHEELLTQNEVLNNKQLKIEEQSQILENRNFELESTKVELLKSIDQLKDARDKLYNKEAESKSILNALNEHYLVAQYNLDGTLFSIDSKTSVYFGKVSSKKEDNFKPILDQSQSDSDNVDTFQQFEAIWDEITAGASKTIEFKVDQSGKSKYLSTTLAPLFNSHNEVHRILAIGQDITELKEKNKKIDKINRELKETIFEGEQQNQLLNFQQKQIFDKSEELKLQSEEIRSINESLEMRVKERTRVLEEKNKQLAEYAFINSHVLRAPVSTMMGLINLIGYAGLSAEDQKIYTHLKETAQILDNVVVRINAAIDQGFHFDRNYLEPEREFEPMNKV